MGNRTTRRHRDAATRGLRALAPFLLLALSATPSFAGWRLQPVDVLTRSGQAVMPAVAPNGRTVAYLVGSRLQVPGALDVVSGRLWMFDRATGQPLRVGRLNVDAVPGEQIVTFSPHGGAYAYVEGARATPILWYVDADGNRFRVGSGRAASFSPDGKFLAYIAWDRSGGDAVELWLFLTASHESKRLVRLAAREPLQVATAPKFSADGARIIYQVDRTLYSYVRAKGRSDRLEPAGQVETFDVTPGGQVIYYLRGNVSSGDDGLYATPPDLSRGTLLFPAEELPPDISSLTAGPDANTVLFLANTAAGYGLVAADVRAGKWRFLDAAQAYSVMPGGSLVALERLEGQNRHNIYLERLTPEKPSTPAVPKAQPAVPKSQPVVPQGKKTTTGGRT